jgi:hypothetical protein
MFSHFTSVYTYIHIANINVIVVGAMCTQKKIRTLHFGRRCWYRSEERAEFIYVIGQRHGVAALTLIRWNPVSTIQEKMRWRRENLPLPGAKLRSFSWSPVIWLHLGSLTMAAFRPRFFQWPTRNWYQALTGFRTRMWCPVRGVFHLLGGSSLGKWVTFVEYFKCAAHSTKAGPQFRKTSPYTPHNDGKSIIFCQCWLTTRHGLLQRGYDNTHVAIWLFSSTIPLLASQSGCCLPDFTWNTSDKLTQTAIGRTTSASLHANPKQFPAHHFPYY